MQVQRVIDKFGNSGPNEETEVRFGRFSPRGFVPGIGVRAFQEIEAFMVKQPGWTRTTTFNSVEAKGNIRKIRKNSENIYEMKQKIDTVDVTYLGLRFAKSREQRSRALKNVWENNSNPVTYKKDRDRITFVKGGVRIDMTKPDQLEVEWKTVRSSPLVTINMLLAELRTIRKKSAIYNDFINLVGGRRFPGPLPRALTKELFSTRVLTKREYSVTDKADGERQLMFISKGRAQLISRKMDITVLDKPMNNLDNTVLDGEFYNNKFYAFDVLFIKGVDLRNDNLKRRLAQLDKVEGVLKKKFYFENGDTIYNLCGKVWDGRNKLPYPLDGLIFTPVNEPYYNDKILKWKDEPTIDFYYNGNKLYLAGGNPTKHMTFEEANSAISKDNTISPQLRKGLLDTPINGPPGVGEFAWRDNTFKMIRKRPDKEFGNRTPASDEAWEAITKPVTVEMLKRGPGNMRDFHNEIKRRLIMKYCKDKRVVDMGSGKGEDVRKYVDAKVKEVVGFDIIDEEYPHPPNMKFFKISPNGFDMASYVTGKFDVMNINFALHYFLRDKKLFKTLMNNVNRFIPSGGVIMATVLDGSQVWSSLKKGRLDREKFTIEKNYTNIEDINFNSKKFLFLGQKIKVFLKNTKYFSEGGITEYLFNFTKFMQIMDLLGFDVVEQGSFKDFCEDSKWCSRYMSEEEKEYSFKNMYFVIKRK